MPAATADRIRRAVLAAVHAADAEDPAAFDDAIGELARLDPQQVSLVVAGALQLALLRGHPDGVATADVRQLIADTAAGAQRWYPELDPAALAAVVLGALGALDPEQPIGSQAGLNSAGCLLLAAVTGDGADVTDAVDASLAELRRAETIELP